MTHPAASTLGELRRSGWRSRTVKEEMRANLLDQIRRSEPLLPGILGSDEMTIHYGLLPRTHRGIFAINELPDLAERIQVGLLNVMEERDVQIRGYRVRLNLDLFVIASANPEDYTSRGRIITPLKDRFGAQIRTHYPEEAATEIAIMEQEATAFETDERDAIAVHVPGFMKEIVAELSQLARRSSEVSQRSGVSVRVTINNAETLAATALKRAVRLGEPTAAPRISDLPAVVASTAGKIELETLGDEAREDRVVEKLLARPTVNVFNRRFALSELAPLIERFEAGAAAEVGEYVPSSAHEKLVSEIAELRRVIGRLDVGESPASLASGVEFVLEGLHLNRRLNKERRGGAVRYAR